MQESERKYHAIFDQSFELVGLLGLDGKLLEANSTSLQFTGAKKAEVIGKPFWQTKWWSHSKKLQIKLKAAIQQAKNGEFVRFEATIPRVDGTIADIDFSIKPVFDESGNVVMLVPEGHDITKSKELIHALQQSEEKYRNLFNSASDLIIVLDTSGKVIECNTKLETQAGWKREEILNKNIFTTNLLTEDAKKQAMAQFAQRIQGKELPPYEIEGRSRDGRTIPYEVNAVAIKDKGKITTILATLRNITERKRTLAELEKYRNHLEDIVKERTTNLEKALTSLDIAKKEAEAANQAKSIFLANMSHEIRTPMNAVLGYAQLLLRDSNLQDAQREFVQIIIRSGDHLLALINDILEISKIEAGRVGLNEEAFNFRMLLTDMESMFRIRAAEKSLLLEFHVSDDVPTTIHADAGKIRQIIINLLGNAVKFTDEGGIIIRVYITEATVATNKILLCIEVEDSGKGIAPEDLDKIFNAFDQNISSGIKGRGAGLGLMISSKYAQMMNGKIAVESQLGKGSIFRFTFPTTICASKIDKAKETKKTISHLPEGVKPRVLVVDDDAPSRNILKLLLSNAGFIVEQATNGKEAVLITQEWLPDLILMDIIMPVMNGIEATQTIKTTLKSANIPIIIITASPFEQEHQKAINAGANSFIRKPFIAAEVFEKIGKILHLSYVYTEQSTAEQISEKELANVATIPKQLKNKITEAAELGDSTKLQTLIVTNVTPLNPQLSKLLQQYLNNYDYEKIIKLITDIKESKI